MRFFFKKNIVKIFFAIFEVFVRKIKPDFLGKVDFWPK